MKLTEKLEKTRLDADHLNEALLAAAESQIQWLKPMELSTIGGMKPKMLRIGLIERTEKRNPLVIQHNLSEGRIGVWTPQEASMWDWCMVDKLPQLDAFLRKHALGWPVYVHTPSFAWIRREVEAKTKA